MSRVASARGLLLALCIGATTVPAYAAETAPAFTPEAGFDGSSHGNGTLRLLLGRERPFHVDSVGAAADDGSFHLDQVVAFEGKAPQRRAWVIRRVAPRRYAGTLTDASGPVRGETDGSTLQLRYRVRSLLVMHQTLTLAPDGRTIDNLGRVSLLGIPVGRLHETIVRDAVAPAP